MVYYDPLWLDCFLGGVKGYVLSNCAMVGGLIFETDNCYEKFM